MLIIIGIITAIIVFSIIVLVHEFGHFRVARFFGVKVEEFGLGIPPKARKLFTDKHGTEYTLNWLPLGGFVRLKGESIHTFEIYDEHGKLFNNVSLEKAIKENKNIFDRDKNNISSGEKQAILEKLKDNYAKDSLLTKPYYAQAAIILAGVCMNFILAIFIFFVLFLIGVRPIGINDQIKIDTDLKLIPSPEKALEIGLILEKTGAYLSPVENSIAAESGIKNYDLALKINNIEISNYQVLKEEITKNKNNPITLDVQRAKNGCDISKSNSCEFENISVMLTPDSEGKIGSYLIPNSEINKDFVYKYGVVDSLKYATIETYGQIKLTFKGIGILVKKILRPETPKERQEAIQQVSGPIGIVDFMTKSIGNGIIFITIIGALISINLGVFNLLPIPALDGGRFLFIVINSSIEKIFGKKAINERLEGYIHVGFFIFLIALSVLIAYNDINKIINN